MPYIYQADLWCDDCGKEICKRLDAEGRTPENPDDERSYDSDEYPKYVGRIGESDSVDHCASGEDCLNAEVLPSGWKIGAWLENDLTSHGEAWLKETVKDSPSEVTDYWKTLYDYIDYEGEEDDDEF